MSTITRFAVPGLLAIVGAGSAVAQESRTEVACDDDWTGGNRSSVNVCESREFTLTQEESLQINGSPNGSVSVTGWDRNEFQVRALVRSWDRNEDTARDRLDEIAIDTDGVLRAYGPYVRNSWWPFGRRNGGWNVSFEIMAPRDTDLWIESVNGRISVTDMRGHLDAETTNGGISLANVSAAVRGRTVNGGISAVFADDTFDGDIFDVRTTNGGIVMRIPEDFSARLDVETVNGGVSSDFPVTREGDRNREVSGTLGSGEGPLIRARTVNGGVQITQL
ncbi:MAG TPA: DUF4097 family beta strand repeat-containing protein [Gammaproteobacteria bacterium]|nr:DUF4097 family beta strand repeat-containing protein [Gammaproteobacteria bacterium]